MTKRMVKQSLLIVALVMFMTGAASAVGLARSPVHEAMRAAIADGPLVSSDLRADKSDDEFGDDSDEDEFGDGKKADKFDDATKTSGTSGRKSLFKAALFSAIVPGGGQYYLGNKRTARYFFAAEAATWVAYLSFHTYGDWRKDDYIKYAAEHANAQLEGKSEDFLTWVGFYNNIREFNTFGRVSDPERAYLRDTPENHWEWQSADERRMYRDLKNGSKEAYRRSDFMIVAAVVDRIISIIDAVRSASRMGREIEVDEFSLQPGGKIRFTVDPLASRQVCVTFSPGF